MNLFCKYQNCDLLNFVMYFLIRDYFHEYFILIIIIYYQVQFLLRFQFLIVQLLVFAFKFIIKMIIIILKLPLTMDSPNFNHIPYFGVSKDYYLSVNNIIFMRYRKNINLITQFLLSLQFLLFRSWSWNIK